MLDIRRRHRSAAFAMLAVLALAAPVLAGPPLLCHPFNIGDARSLPWDGTRAFWEGRADYRLEHLAADTEALLTPSTPVIVRMETLRRAALYASADAEIAAGLYTTFSERLLASQTNGRASGLAKFDFDEPEDQGLAIGEGQRLNGREGGERFGPGTGVFRGRIARHLLGGRPPVEIDGAVAGDRREPRAERAGRAQRGQALERREEHLLHEVVHFAERHPGEQDPVDHRPEPLVEPPERFAVSGLRSQHQRALVVDPRPERVHDPSVLDSEPRVNDSAHGTPRPVSERRAGPSRRAARGRSPPGRETDGGGGVLSVYLAWAGMLGCCSSTEFRRVGMLLAAGCAPPRPAMRWRPP